MNETIRAVKDVKNALSRMRRRRGESIASFAERLYDRQMEIYSANAGRDLKTRTFGELYPGNRRSWLIEAKTRSRKAPTGRK